MEILSSMYPLSVSVQIAFSQEHLEDSWKLAKFVYVQKMTKYSDLGARFKPLVIESTGRWHPYSFD
jgi:hypothetical protein